MDANGDRRGGVASEPSSPRESLRTSRRARAVVAYTFALAAPVTVAAAGLAARHLWASRVVLVNVHIPRSWGDAANDVLADAVKGWPQARIADWHAAGQVPGVLYPDGTHPTPEGQEVYAALVERALR